MASGVREDVPSTGTVAGTSRVGTAGQSLVDTLKRPVTMRVSPIDSCNAISDAWHTLSATLLPNSGFENVLKHVRALFRNTVQFTMSVEFDRLPVETKNRLKAILKTSPHMPCQVLSQLLPNPWTRFPIRSLFWCDEESGEFDTSRPLPTFEHSCSSACLLEPRHLSRARFEVLCFADFEAEALQLSLACDQCVVLQKDSFYKASAFGILHSVEKITRLTTEVSKMTCHDGYRLMQQIQTNYGLAADSLVECLTQILLVRDFVGPSSYCCTLSLINLWCSIHVYNRTNLDVVSQEVMKLGLLASTSAHIYLFVDVLFKQYGRQLLVLYLHLYVRALTWDLNSLEYCKLLHCDITVTEMEVHLAAIFSKLASLLSVEEDLGLARECVLTAFSLEPTTERLSRLQMWSTYGQSVGPPRLYPCAGQCHCSEKGLCRQNLPYSTVYATHMPHEILDTTIAAGKIPVQLLQDLCIVVEGPRCKRLTWSLSWEALSEICERYLRHARRKSARGESLEARLRRRSQFEKWVTKIKSEEAEEEDTDTSDDEDDEDAMPVLKREVINDADASSGCAKSSSWIASQALGNAEQQRSESPLLAGSPPGNMDSYYSVTQGTEKENGSTEADRQQDVFACPLPVTETVPMPTVNENYEMSRMDCLELEEAVRQLTDTDAPSDHAQEILGLVYHQDATSASSQKAFTSPLLERHVEDVLGSLRAVSESVGDETIAATAVPMQTDRAPGEQLTSMSSLESLLESVSTMNPYYGQSSCEGIELLANSALQYGSLVGLQRSPVIASTLDLSNAAASTLTTSSSSSAAVTVAAVQPCQPTTSTRIEQNQQMCTNISQEFYAGDNRKVRSARGGGISLSDLVQSALSDDPPQISPPIQNHTSLEYNWQASSSQQSTSTHVLQPGPPPPPVVSYRSFEANNLSSTSVVFAVVDDATHFYDANQVRVPITAYATDDAMRRTTTATATMTSLQNSFATVPDERMLLTVPAATTTTTTTTTTTMMEPQYLTVRTSSPAIPKTRKCIFRSVPVSANKRTSSAAAASVRRAPGQQSKKYVSRVEFKQEPLAGLARVKIEPTPEDVYTNDVIGGMASRSLKTESFVAAATDNNISWPYGASISNPYAYADEAAHDDNRPTYRCNDILSQATMMAFGDDHHAVIVEPQFTSNSVPTALQIMTPNFMQDVREEPLTVPPPPPPTATPVARRRPVFNHRKDRCKWMSVFSPHGKLGYRKVVEEKSADTNQNASSRASVVAATAVVTPKPTTAFSVPENKVNKVTVPSPKALSITSAAITTTTVTTLASTSIASQSSTLVTTATAAAPAIIVKPPLPVVKKCYSSILVAAPTNAFGNQVKSVPRVFTVSAPAVPMVRSVANPSVARRMIRPKTLAVEPAAGIGTFVSLAQTFMQSGLRQQQQLQRRGGTSADGTIRSQILATLPAFIGTPRSSVSIPSTIRPVHSQPPSTPAIILPKPPSVVRLSPSVLERVSAVDTPTVTETGLVTSAMKTPPSSSSSSSSSTSSTSTSSNGVSLHHHQLQTAMLQPKVVLEQCILTSSAEVSPNRMSTKTQHNHSESANTKTPRPNDRFQCPVCTKILSSPFCLRRHIKAVHKIDNPDQSSLKNFPISPTLKVNVVRLNIDNLKPLKMATLKMAEEAGHAPASPQPSLSRQQQQQQEEPTATVNGGHVAVEQVNCDESVIKTSAEDRLESNLPVKEEHVSRFLNDLTTSIESQQETVTVKNDESETWLEYQAEEEEESVQLCEPEPLEGNQTSEETKTLAKVTEEQFHVALSVLSEDSIIAADEVLEKSEEEEMEDEEDVEEEEDDDDDDDASVMFAFDDEKERHVKSSVLTRGRTNARAAKMSSKRGCPCCENDSPNSSSVTSSSSSVSKKKCRGRGRPKKNRVMRRASTNRSTRSVALRVTRRSTTRAAKT